MIIKKCDRCGYTDDGEFKRSFLTLEHNNKRRDLCSCCMVKYNTLIRNMTINFLNNEI